MFPFQKYQRLLRLCRNGVLAMILSSPLSASNGPWFQRHIVGMEVGPTGAQFGNSDPEDVRYCSRWDGREIVRKAKDANSEYLVIWARDGDFAYYDSEILPKAPGLGDRDPLREAVEEAKKCRLPLIAYCVVQQGGLFLKAHPEWEMKGQDGQPIGRFCYNSGYLEAMKKIVSELLAYGVDGLHVDMLDQGFGSPYGCWCQACQDQFQGQYGHDMPAGATWDEAWDEMLAFRYQTSEQFERRLAGHIRSVNPEATVDFNYHGNPPFSFEVGQRPVQHADNSDFVTGETGKWAFSALGVGLNAEFYRAATPGLPFQIAIQRGVRMYHDQTTRPLNDIRWELLLLLARGAFVTMVDKTGFDGWLDPVAYERIGKAFAEGKRKRDHFGQAPVYDMGLYFSSRTRDWKGREEPFRYFESFLGAHRVCAMEHLQFGVVLDENATLEGLKRFPVLCLPNAGILSNREVALFASYVKEGGTLLITGQTGQFDRLGRPLEAFVLSDLVGGNVRGRLDSQDNWVRLGKGDLQGLNEDLRENWPFLVKGPATEYVATTAQEAGELMAPYRTSRQMRGEDTSGWPMSAERSVGPAVLLNRVGKGTVLTVSSSPCVSTASEHAIVEARTLFRNAFRLLCPEPRVAIEAPSSVEAVVTDDPDARLLRIHFIACNQPPRTIPSHNRPYVIPGLIEDAPMFKVSLRLSDSPKKVETLNPSTEVNCRGKHIEALIEDIHETLVVAY